MPRSNDRHVVARRVQLLALIVASLALGLVVGGTVGWLPLPVILMSWVAWRAGDRQIRGVLADPGDAHAAHASLPLSRR